MISHHQLLFLIVAIISIVSVVNSSDAPEYILTNYYLKSNTNCSNTPYQSFGYAVDQCIRATTTSSYKYTHGKDETTFVHYSWATSATCSGQGGYSSFTLPTECNSNAQKVHTTELPPWKGNPTGFLLQSYGSNDTCQAATETGYRYYYYALNECIPSSTGAYLGRKYISCDPAGFVQVYEYADQNCQQFQASDWEIHLPCYPNDFSGRTEYTTLLCV